YFYSPPGFGKSTAARLIPQFLGLPCYETNIRTAEDLSQRSLEGGDWQRQLATPGHIARALMQGSFVGKEKHATFKMLIPHVAKYGLEPELEINLQVQQAVETYENTFLVTNDFDRLLLDAQTSTQSLAFFLDYLDPLKINFF